jgi:hypothetical protein
MIAFVVLVSIVGRVIKPYRRLKDIIATLFAVGLISIFAIAFGGMGIGLLIQSLHRGDPQGAAFSLPFILIGAVALAALIFGTPALLKQGRLKALYPDQPWLWDSDWATGQIPDHAIAGVIGGWIIALVVSGMVIPATFGAMSKFARTHDPRLLVVWILMAVSFWLIFRAIRTSIRAATFGKSIFKLSTLPASPGGSLMGVVRVPKLLQPTGPVRLHLTCTEQRRSSGEDASPKVICYQDSQHVTLPPSSKPGRDIPVHFSLPRDVPATSGTGRTQIAWQLEVTAPCEEVDYSSRFKIPVFLTGQTAARDDLAR